MIRRLRSLAAGMPAGSMGLAGGLAAVGVATYVFLLIVGQVLGDTRYAPFGALWMLVYLTGPGFFFPVEQEVTRAVASRRALGEGVFPIIRQAATAAAVLAALLAVIAVAGSGLIFQPLFDRQWLLMASFVLAIGTFAAVYVVRGSLAGSGQLQSYGLLMTAEGLSRVALAAVLVGVGTHAAGPYGLLVAVAPLIAIAVVFPRLRRVFTAGPQSHWRELSLALRDLVAASVLSQALVNLAPLVVKALANASEQGLAGAFSKAVIITRIPLFLFQAIQAAMLPRLAHLATVKDYRALRVAMRRMLLIVALIGGGGTVVITAATPLLLFLFGSDAGLRRTDMALLGGGNALFLLAMTAGQALVALRHQRSTVYGWLAGVLVFLAAVLLPAALILRVELALLFGSAAAFCVMLVELSRRVTLLQRHAL